MRVFRKVLVVASICLSGISAIAQDGAYGGYSPYSVFGIGELERQGNAYNKSMGGVGIATRNKRFLNYMNPASVTSRDTLSFMCDFSIVENNELYKQNFQGSEYTSGNNTFNMADFAISFPVYRSFAMMVGVTPYSNVGYDFSSVEKTDKELIAETGNLAYQAYGYGGMYELFIGGGFIPVKGLSVGGEFIYYFGNINKVTNTVFSESSYRSINGGNNLQLHAPCGKFGIQYEQKLGSDVTMVAGATYKMKANLRGYTNDFSYAVASEMTDTLRNSVDTLKTSHGVRFADELGIGICFKGGDRWSAEFDYLRSGWENTGLETVEGFSVTGTSGMKFTTTVSQSFRAGFEFVPNRNDIRYYFRRCSYKAGVYYDKEYYQLDGNMIDTRGITLGVTLPVHKYYNGLTLAVDMGRKGSLKNSMIRERYITLNVGFNIHDIWFQKQRYQ